MKFSSLKKLGLMTASAGMMLFIFMPQVYAATGVISSSTDTPTQVASWPSQASGTILSLSGDSNGHIYNFDANGTEVTVRKSSDMGGSYSNWTGIAIPNQPDGGMGVNPLNGHLYYGNAQDGFLYETDSDGNLIHYNFLAMSEPQGVAFDTSGNVYTTDLDQGVIEYSSDTTKIRAWCPSFGGCLGNTTFMGSRFIAVNPVNGHVYLDNGVIHEFTNDGSTLLKTWTGISGALATDTLGDVYVARNNVVEEYTIDGTLIQTLNIANSGLIFIDKDNNIFVANSGNIVRYSVPQNVATVTGAGGDNLVQLTAGAGIGNFTSISSDDVVGSNGAYTYPLGLINFTVTPLSGGSVQIHAIFQTNLKSDQVIPQKYDPVAHEYINLTTYGATVSETTLHGKHALEVDYSVTDGGALDQGGAGLGHPDGTINDPITLASIAATGSASAPNTGLPEQNIILPVVLFGTAFGLTCAVWYRKRNTKQ